MVISTVQILVIYEHEIHFGIFFSDFLSVLKTSLCLSYTSVKLVRRFVLCFIFGYCEQNRLCVLFLSTFLIFNNPNDEESRLKIHGAYLSILKTTCSMPMNSILFMEDTWNISTKIRNKRKMPILFSPTRVCSTWDQLLQYIRYGDEEQAKKTRRNQIILVSRWYNSLYKGP